MLSQKGSFVRQIISLFIVSQTGVFETDKIGNKIEACSFI